MLERRASNSATKHLYVVLAETNLCYRCLSHEANSLVAHGDGYRLTGINNSTSNQSGNQTGHQIGTLHNSRGTDSQQECSQTNSRHVLEAHSERETGPRAVLDVFLDILPMLAPCLSRRSSNKRAGPSDWCRLAACCLSDGSFYDLHLICQRDTEKELVKPLLLMLLLRGDEVFRTTMMTR